MPIDDYLNLMKDLYSQLRFLTTRYKGIEQKVFVVGTMKITQLLVERYLIHFMKTLMEGI